MLGIIDTDYSLICPQNPRFAQRMRLISIIHLTYKANTLTDEAKPLTDEADALTDEPNALTDEAKPLTDDFDALMVSCKLLTDA